MSDFCAMVVYNQPEHTTDVHQILSVII